LNSPLFHGTLKQHFGNCSPVLPDFRGLTGSAIQQSRLELKGNPVEAESLASMIGAQHEWFSGIGICRASAA
jgi:hypothetical protein